MKILITPALMLLSLLVAAPLIHRANSAAEDLSARMESRRLNQLRNAGLTEDFGLAESVPASTRTSDNRAR